MPRTKMPRTKMIKSTKHRWPEIERKMQAVAEILGKQGGLTVRLSGGRRIWSVRFRKNRRNSRRIHAAIYVGSDPDLVRRARKLLDEFRGREASCREAEQIAKFAAAFCRVVAKNKKHLKEVWRG